MSRPLGGRVVLVTGAGRGIGAEHALLLARLGAAVVVNDVDGPAAEAVAAEVLAAGGRSVAVAGDVADWETGRVLVETAVTTFGDLHVLVNNAGIVRDRYLANLSEQEWDEVVRVHLKGHFVPTRWAARHWRARSRAGQPVGASVVNTTSISGLAANPGQANYGAAKAGIAALTQCAAAELGRYGVRVNAIAPLARTRLTQSTPPLAASVAPPTDPEAFDTWHPANVSPLVAYLATRDCPLSGQVFLVHGRSIQRFEPWSAAETLEAPGRWTIDGLQAALARFAAPDG